MDFRNYFFNTFTERLGHWAAFFQPLQGSLFDLEPRGLHYRLYVAHLVRHQLAEGFRLIDEATAAFEKAVAADPTFAEAYYQMAVNLLGKASLDKENKMVAPPGTAEAFNKYLELEPTGSHAEEVKGMLTYIGAPIQTTYGKPKTTTKAKPK